MTSFATRFNAGLVSVTFTFLCVYMLEVMTHSPHVTSPVTYDYVVARDNTPALDSAHQQPCSVSGLSGSALSHSSPAPSHSSSSPSQLSSALNHSSSAHRHVFYLKTHKTGSTTMYSILAEFCRLVDFVEY